jgi:transposase
LPESGIIIRRTGKYRYVYKVLRTFRNGNGQPTNERKLIGRLDADSGRLIPNDSYFEFFAEAKLEIQTLRGGIRSIGASFLVEWILSRLGAYKALEDSLGQNRSMDVLTVAAYMLCRGNVIEHINDWCDGFTLREPHAPQSASSLFASITHAERMAFFKAWVNLNDTSGCLAYDVTSFSSYAEGIRDAEWGYNRDGDRLPQINMGCYLSHKSGLPMFYVTYPGSIVDKAHMPYMMVYNEELGIGKTVFVMDRGFCSTSNILWLHECRMRYVMGVNAHHKATRDAIDKAKEGIATLLCRVKEGVYAKTVHSRFYGTLSDMHIYYDPDLAEKQRSDMFRLIESWGETLVQFDHITEKDARRYSRFFDIDIKDGAFSYSLNHEKIDLASKNCGFFCILSNTSMSAAEILDIYRRKDVIEKGFDDIKNHIDMKRLRTHSSASTDGKLFCAFIALIVASSMSEGLRGINAVGGHRKLGKNAVVSELEKIKIVMMEDGSRLMNPLTKRQRVIYEAFGTNEDDLKSYAARCLGKI